MRRSLSLGFALHIVAVLLAACGTPAPNSSASTALPVEATSAPVEAATAAPTAAPTADPALLAATPLAEAAGAIGSADYETAVTVLERAHATSPESAEITNALAAAYGEWGRTLLLATSQGEGRLQTASFRFSQGLGIDPSDSAVRAQLQNGFDATNQIVQVYTAAAGMRQEGADTAARQASASQASAALAQIAQIDPALLGSFQAEQLFQIANDVSAVGDALGDFNAGVPLWQQSQQVCELIKANFGPDAASNADQCIATQQAKQTLPPTATPKPTPRPTPKPTVATVTVPDYHGSDVNLAEADLKRLGFRSIAKSVDSQPGNVCKGQVTYSTPSGGSRVPVTTTIRLFYRSFDSNGC